MAKKVVKPNQKYSIGDQCLIALLSEPIKRHKIKFLDTVSVKLSEELLQSLISNKTATKTPVSSSSSSSTTTT